MRAMEQRLNLKRENLLGCLLLALTLNQAILNGSVQAQDILRQQVRSSNSANNPLANIQLPPELASLTPQQLHQLAQLREIQLQQQATAGQQSANSAPEPIGLEALPAAPGAGSGKQQAAAATTAQPSASGQIPPSSSGSNDQNERYDDGAYNEASSELEGVAEQDSGAGSGGGGGSLASLVAGNGNGNSSAAAPTFEVNWNKCPQLEPSESEKSKKTQVITKCLHAAPIPQNLTRENVEAHREQIATCALRVEGWFDEQQNYKYDKAEAEIRAKKLEPAIEIQVLKFHVACREEANKKFPRELNKLIDQVQFYQACMDYYISIVCEIEVSVDQ